MDGPEVRRIVLVGFMAAGKSSIAPRLALALGWRVLDVDAAIVAAAGRSIAAIFRDDGEPAFRRLEAELTARLSSGPPVVVAPGAGWITNPERREVLEDRATRVIWLRVSIDEALRRARGDGTERPLLQGAEPKSEATRLLAEREPLYASADFTIDVDGRSEDEVVDDILTWLKTSIS
ncbi:MAG: shikimate kinase [Longimicrobiales bacterium]